MRYQESFELETGVILILAINLRLVPLHNALIVYIFGAYSYWAAFTIRKSSRYLGKNKHEHAFEARHTEEGCV
jgi:hypothetical protein